MTTSFGGRLYFCYNLAGTSPAWGLCRDLAPKCHKLPSSWPYLPMFLCVTIPFYQSPRPETSEVSCSKLVQSPPTQFPLSVFLSTSTSCLFCRENATWDSCSPLSFLRITTHNQVQALLTLTPNNSSRSLKASLPPTTTCSLSNPPSTAVPSLLLRHLQWLFPKHFCLPSRPHCQHPQRSCNSPTSISSWVEHVSSLPVAIE